MNNIVVAVALMIGASWAWGSVGVMQRNYDLQKEIDDKQRQQIVAELEVATLAYQQKYYKTSEYQELAIRERLGLANPGEKVLSLPANSETVRVSNTSQKNKTTVNEPTSNFEQWMNFLFGGNHEKVK